MYRDYSDTIQYSFFPLKGRLEEAISPSVEWRGTSVVARLGRKV
jgi:hypothetical protein